MVDLNEDIKNCVNTLSAGGIILYPTDTIWGLGCDATNEQAVEKIFKAKNRTKEKSLIILLAEERDIMQYVAAPPPEIFEFLEEQTVPTTIIFENALGLADNVIHENGSVAIRVTKDSFCKTIIKQLGCPLVSTSANISGTSSAALFKDIDPALIRAVDYVAHHRRLETTARRASSIFRQNEQGVWQQIR